MSDLTQPQQDLLTEIEASTEGGVYIADTAMQARSARCLLRKGYVTQARVDADTCFYGPLTHPDDPEMVPDEE